MTTLNTSIVHPTWLPFVVNALSQLNLDYLKFLEQDTSWLPGPKIIFNTFSLPLNKTRYILFGESPYPRQESANGFAFWDASVHQLWSSQGLSKNVNRATSLRNFIKMLLVGRGDLTSLETSQISIANLDKSKYIGSIDELFNNLLNCGVLLLNANLALTSLGINKDAKAWRPFMAKILEQLGEVRPDIEIILLGKVAKNIGLLPSCKKFKQLTAEHPYNLSFITNPDIIDFFKPFDLLSKQ